MTLPRTMFTVLAASACLLAQQPVPAPAPAPNATPPSATAAKAPAAKVAVYDETADARADVAKALQRARLENRRVLIQWGANWCHWCTLLAERLRSDQALARELLYEYDFVKIDVGRFDKNLDLMKELGAEFKAIPFVTILDADGKAVAQQDTEPFETKGGDRPGHDAAKLLAFLQEHQAAPLDAGKVRAGALAQAKTQGKLVFLHFGAPWCPWCHQLDDWMRAPANAELLARAFVDLKIDTDRMTGGQGQLDAERQRAGSNGGGIPWIALLDGDGKQVATGDGPKGNIGFPAEAHEIEWFGTMLERAHVATADIATLQASLVAWREAMGRRGGH